MKVQFSGLSVIKVFIGTLFFYLFLTTFSSGQIKYDDCDKEACRAESKIAEANVKKICYTQPVNNAACIAAFQEWERLIALNCPKTKKPSLEPKVEVPKTADSENEKPDGKNAKVLIPDKDCEIDMPPSPHTAKSFNRDFVENIIDPLFGKFPQGMSLENQLLVAAQAYAESAGNYQDKKTKAFKASNINNIFNLQFTQDTCPINVFCIKVSRKECRKLKESEYAANKIDPNDPQNAPVVDPANAQLGQISLGSEPNTFCRWQNVSVFVPTFSNPKESLDFYFQFLKDNFPDIYNKIKNNSSSPQDIIDAMKKFGTDPAYKQNLTRATPQILQAIADYAQQKIDAIDDAVQCEIDKKTKSPAIKSLKDKKAQYEAIKKAAENLKQKL